ncbi:hypothetical protein BD310DRAFT_924563 [Dichomitus squalens]|uniref:Secreted protein n=1 Tax=Dichomitus squalens TaxID=114155 RepID=A0A4Q9PZ15_9APHY|nr:hypothetical protein BD310DRAFT_924563 [Dichomitus squalens]
MTATLLRGASDWSATILLACACAYVQCTRKAPMADVKGGVKLQARIKVGRGVGLWLSAPSVSRIWTF